MLGFLKVFGKGVLYTILFPFIVLILALFTIYCIGLFIYQFIRAVITWISGGDPFADTKEDIEAKKILLERQNQGNGPTADQTKDAVIAALANAVLQQQQNMQQQPNNPQEKEIPTYDVFPTEEIEQNEPSLLEQYIDERDDQ